ncbi:putative Maintenance of mitochondrial morphology protein 1 [Glarea lozoyensis 74030]|uniref:Putative Maintenance of mitochondrial morphology protein 1 n=1 Tax=Glarea lozoyensis (strain ATCC 74030 / MF5533) TaxID=1104152 RepID=H0EIE5_GLAL7|nr:putative Maintenance of mitochondrial morphology protein 1 [Glarea lozoyensis 74030]
MTTAEVPIQRVESSIGDEVAVELPEAFGCGLARCFGYLSIRSLVGSRSRLQDVPKIASLVEARLHTWFDERCVEPRFQQIELPSLWPRKKNTRNAEGASEPASISRAKGKEMERDLREEARREVEAEVRARQEVEGVEDDGLRWRRRARGDEFEYDLIVHFIV